MKKFLLLFFAITLLFVLFKYYYTPKNIAQAIIPSPCRYCDAYGKCATSSSTSCDPGSNECSADWNCSGFSPTPRYTATPTPSPRPIDPNCGQACEFNEDCGSGGLSCVKFQCKGINCSTSALNYYNCPVVNGIPYCKQTNPLWAAKTLGCTTELYKRACGQSTTCSFLCKKYGGDYCSVDKCISKVPDFANNPCSLWGSVALKSVLTNNGFVTDRIFPDVMYNPSTGQQISEPYISEEKLKEALKNGPMLVSGKFKLKTGGSSIEHHSIVQLDSNGNLIWNDPYFNSQNPDPNYQINTPYLLEKLDITLTSAFIVNQ